MLSLNEIYKNNNLFYYCNACGDISIPDTDPWSIHESAELPLRERNLYENYWMEGVGCNMYVVRFYNQTAMALTFLFDDGYCSDILGMDCAQTEDMDRFYNAMCDYAKMLKSDAKLKGCDILVGNNTDPCGHELVIIVPYELRGRIKQLAEYLDQHVYSSVEELF